MNDIFQDVRKIQEQCRNDCYSELEMRQDQDLCDYDCDRPRQGIEFLTDVSEQFHTSSKHYMKPLLSDVHLPCALRDEGAGSLQRGRLAQHPSHQRLPPKHRRGGGVQPMGSDGSNN